MKLHFNIFILIISLEVTAKPIIYLTYHRKTRYVESSLNVLKNDLNLPAILIQVLQQKPACKKVMEALWQICLTDKNLIYNVVYNKNFISQTLKIFSATKL